MGETTSISWTEKTHNFWYGCKKVSQGCRSCYAERQMTGFGKDFGTITRAKGFDKPLKWKDPAMVFTCSWSDFFIEEADEWRDEAWEIIRQTPHLTYQILTKRPENVLSRLPDDWGEGWDNVWLGVSVEDQKNAIERIPPLVEIPAKIRFLSCEPLLGPIDLLPTHNAYPCAYWLHFGEFTPYGIRPIHWVIVGGESGPNCRPMKLEWVRDIRDQCKANGVPFFMKQLGGHPDRREDIDKFPEDLRIQEFPVVIEP